MLTSYIKKLVNQENLMPNEITEAMEIILQTDNPIQIAGFLVALRTKGETAEEILGVVRAMKKKMIKVTIADPILDIVGVGGDGMNSINISTISAILAASCGVKLLKHGNRAISSKCGSADILENLGVNLNLKSSEIEACVNEIGMGFCFAPHFHPAMKKIQPVRYALGIPTLFNYIGPLLNPAGPDFLMLGVPNAMLLALIPDVLLGLGVKHAMVFHSQGLDEISCVGSSDVVEIKGNDKRQYTLHPKAFGFSLCALEDLQGRDAKENARIAREEIFSGKSGGKLDTILFNAGVAIYMYGIASNISAGIDIARESINSGKAMQFLNKYIDYTKQIGVHCA